MITLISIFDKHEDFIKLQYDSIQKHIKGDYEYIVFNNASTEEQANKNKTICDDLGIFNIRTIVNYNENPSNIAGSALNEAFKHLKDKNVFKIDSDMFFISDLDINDFLNCDLTYIPTYQPNRELMWSGIFGLNMSKINLDLDFKPHVILETDTFGQSILLTSDDRYSKKTFCLYMIGSANDTTIKGGLNNDCSVEFENGNIIKWDKPIEYPVEVLNESNKMINKFNQFNSLLKKYEFPEPYNVDLIELNGVNSIIHFKSANWCEWYTENYVNAKKIAITNLLNETKQC